MDEKELNKIKKKIEDAEKETSRLEGRKSHLMDELKEKWGCETIEDAEKEYEKLKKRYQELEKELSEMVENLKNTYDL